RHAVSRRVRDSRYRFSFLCQKKCRFLAGKRHFCKLFQAHYPRPLHSAVRLGKIGPLSRLPSRNRSPMNHAIRFTAPRVNPGLRPLVILLTGLLALLFCLRNPLFHGMAPGFDASLFAVMGKMWSEGGVLYRDMIDIKGPMIFALD